MAAPNSINIVLLERCWHPLTGSFPDGHELDDPLDLGQVRMLRTAVDRMLEHASSEERGLVAAMAGDGHIIPTTMDAGTARRLSGLIDHLWRKTPEEEQLQLKDWFRCFNSSPERRGEPPARPEAKEEDATASSGM